MTSAAPSRNTRYVAAGLDQPGWTDRPAAFTVTTPAWVMLDRDAPDDRSTTCPVRR